MTKEEFMAELRKIPGHNHEIIMPENYAIIERVYTWHPSIPNVDGKSVIAHLYAYGGMMVIRDMCARAENAMAADAGILRSCSTRSIRGSMPSKSADILRKFGKRDIIAEEVGTWCETWQKRT